MKGCLKDYSWNMLNVILSSILSGLFYLFDSMHAMLLLILIVTWNHHELRLLTSLRNLVYLQQLRPNLSYCWDATSEFSIFDGRYLSNSCKIYKKRLENKIEKSQVFFKKKKTILDFLFKYCLIYGNTVIWINMLIW